MTSHDHYRDGSAVPELKLRGQAFPSVPPPGISHRAMTAFASLVAVSAGLVAPAMARADDTGATTTVPTNTTTTGSTPPTDTTTTPTTTTPTTTTTTTTTTTPTLTTPTGTSTVTTPGETTPPYTSTTTTTSTTPVSATVPSTTLTTTTRPTAGRPTGPHGRDGKTKVTGRQRAHRKHHKGAGVPLSGPTSTNSRKHRGKPRGRRHHMTTSGGVSVEQAKSKVLANRAKAQAAHAENDERTASLATLTPAGGTTSSTWGGTVMANPFTSAQLARYAALVGGLTEPPKYLVRIYKAAARRYHLPWQVLAAINYVETGYGRDLRFSSVGAEGWMQFMPGTWAEYGLSVNDRGLPVAATADPWLPSDAIFAAARYLAANGARHNLPKAVFAYNHAGWYVQEVLGIAEQIDSHGLKASSKAKRKIAAMRTMARLLNGMPYVWGGGHGDWMVSTGYDCSGFVSAVLHAGGYLQFPVTTQSLPSQPRILSGPGRYVTIFDRTYASLDADHVIIDIDGQWWESGGGGAGGAPSVHRMKHLSGAYLDTFNLILHPKGL
jgi:hypothetical protein